ncbi:MAG: FMN-binding negative transcriptional regulator [Pelagimonas sp.]|jgi:transcriptional regulator|nr:FMN-binding negative transcriptional regulator [Pelagimonas sp.]
MHPNPAFRGADHETALDFARQRAFGTLAVSTDQAPLLAHVPFLLRENAADLHLVRSNPISRVPAGTKAVISVTGPDGYVSPDWYEDHDQVPTWNYTAVHLIGVLHPLGPDQLEALLERQSAAFEARLDKAPWTMSKLSQDQKQRLMRMILPFQLVIEDVQSTFKLNQNKPDGVRQKAAAQIQSGFGSDLGELAQMMLTPPNADGGPS